MADKVKVLFKTDNCKNQSEFIEKAILYYIGYLESERNVNCGLCTDAGVEVNLEEFSRELNAIEGTIWTAIVSLQREDAQRLGFDTGAQWRTKLCKNLSYN